MQPVSPVIPGRTDESLEVRFGENQPQYRALPGVVRQDGAVLSRWKLSWGERISVLFNGHIFLKVLTFNRPIQPVMLATEVDETGWDRDDFRG